MEWLVLGGFVCLLFCSVALGLPLVLALLAVSLPALADGGIAPAITQAPAVTPAPETRQLMRTTPFTRLH